MKWIKQAWARRKSSLAARAKAEGYAWAMAEFYQGADVEDLWVEVISEVDADPGSPFHKGAGDALETIAILQASGYRVPRATVAPYKESQSAGVLTVSALMLTLAGLTGLILHWSGVMA